MGQKEEAEIRFGTTLYDEDGTKVGHVRGFDEHGFYVTAMDGIRGMSVEHLRAGHDLGEAELMWRCWECGEMDHIEEDIPDECPNCGAPREDIYYWTED
ncbi:DUF7130 family rubredoxin-like protein [Haloarchaeobius sp. HRN-SO-5]|uniref:DUF7130 family rubredoxin-like protein n=1 Tax=Haloarchaeobius sp. HRN-SO-5 TaxID=3446118 RepID=UPI003EBF80D4